MGANTLLFFFSYLVLSAVAQDVALKENGYFSSCPISIYDLTISKRTTDAMKLNLVIGGSGEMHTYNISKAASVIEDPAFRKDFRTVVFLHAFGYKPTWPPGIKIIEAYQIRGRHNIILIDNSELTNIDYFRSARLSRYIGARLGQVLSQFRKSGLNMDTLDLVGLSLGGQIAGFVGKAYLKSTGVRLSRIVALDPAGPCFKGADSENRLSKGDADFVQVIHTNGGHLGMRVPVGHVDFYPNGGSTQPSKFGIGCLTNCAHLRAVELWKFAVIYPDKFYGVQCVSMKEVEQDACYQKGRKMAVMGPTANPKVNGIFYLRTTGVEPYFEDMVEDVRQRRRWC